MCWKDQRKINTEVPQKHSKIRKLILWVIHDGIWNMEINGESLPSTSPQSCVGRESFSSGAVGDRNIFYAWNEHLTIIPLSKPLWCLPAEFWTGCVPYGELPESLCRSAFHRLGPCGLCSECRMNKWICPEATTFPGTSHLVSNYSSCNFPVSQFRLKLHAW